MIIEQIIRTRWTCNSCEGKADTSDDFTAPKNWLVIKLTDKVPATHLLCPFCKIAYYDLMKKGENNEA